jgi:soluble lytic murein transglycosylase-like protein
MNSITQSNPIFPTTCGVVSTTRGVLCCYLHEIMLKIFYAVYGTFFDEEGFRYCRKELRVKVFVKADISLCAQKLNLQQAVKYGAVFYLVAAMLILTVGICNHQIESVPYHAPVLVEAAYLSTAITIKRSMVADTAFEQKALQQGAPTPPEPAEPELPFEEFIMRAAQTYQVDPMLIHAIIMAESSYNPRAVSHRGAQGLMQLMPSTAKWLGIEDSFDPAMNIDGGVRYFKRLLDRFDGDVKLALAAYNAGSRYVRKYGGVPPFKATRTYIKKVLRYHRILQEQLAAGSGNGLITG